MPGSKGTYPVGAFLTSTTTKKQLTVASNVDGSCFNTPLWRHLLDQVAVLEVKGEKGEVATTRSFQSKSGKKS